MKKLFESLLPVDRNERTYWLGLAMLFAGLTWSASLFTALTIVGAGMAIESVITSYLAQMIKARKQ